MTSDRWQQIRRLFDEALRQPSRDRAAFLTRACAGDAGLHAEVVSLLDAHAASDDYFDASTGLTLLLDSVAAEETVPDACEGFVLGPYRVVRALGRGGMGSVFLAERTDRDGGVPVAVKLIRRGMDTDDVLRRFEAERQILAGLDHPHIARLLDSGTTDDGRPYFVMEYVQGRPIDVYCDEEGLSVEARLRLFETVCAAVEHAHRNLIVHRDLKPNNILVTADGTVKLLDFGIAKVLMPAAGTMQLSTRTGMRMLTPEYAAPEQIRAAAVSTATDVYALGVVLYQLLTGRRPYELPGRLQHEVERIICEEQPARPSTVVTRGAALPARDGGTQTLSPSDLGRRRGVTAERLRRKLAGDLDNIVMMALRKEPERRYASVAHLSEDVVRHLRDLPVAARPDTARYRASKFVRRHRWGVGVTTLVVLLLLGGGVLVVVQNVRIQRERDKARQVAEFLVDIFEAPDPSVARGDSVLARDILDRGAARVARELRGEPALQAAMMNVMGRVYHRLGLYDTAGELLREGLAMRQSLFPGDHAEVAESLNDTGHLARDAGRFDEADSLQRAALAMRRRLFGAGHPEVAESLNDLALVAIEQGRYDEAEAMLREAVAIRREGAVREAPQLATTLFNLGFLLKERGRYDEAEPLYREALDLRRARLGDDHPDVASSLNNLAALLHRQGRLAETEALQREVLALRRRVFGPSHPDVATALNNLSTSLKDLGRFEEAEAACTEALDIQRRMLGETHPKTVITLYNRALIAQARGRRAEAEADFSRSLDLHRQVWGTDHPYVAFPLTALGQLLVAHGDAAGAEPLLREALALRRAHLSEGNWLTALTESTLGGSLVHQGRLNEAEPLLLGSYAVLRDARGAGDRHTREAVRHLAALYTARSAPEQAQVYFDLLRAGTAEE